MRITLGNREYKSLNPCLITSSTHPIQIAELVFSLTTWNALLEEMYGDAIESKKAVVDEVMKNDKVSETAKSWLKNVSEGK